jgi:hypothetical protein
MHSQFPHGYMYDIFVSYSHLDQERVAAFYAALKKDLSRLGGREFAVFLDEDGLRLGDVWDEKLHAVVQDSAIFLPVLSPGFANSAYCQKEWASFDAANGRTTDDNYRGRVFPIELLPGTPTSHPLLRSQFNKFYRITEKNVPVDFMPNTDEFSDAVRHLANELKDALSRMGPKGEPKPSIYLASNYSRDIETLRRSLEHKFEVVLPPPIEEAIGMKGEAFQQAVRERLGKCFVSVHPLDRGQFAEAFVRQQLDLAQDAGKTRLALAAAESDELSQLMNSGFEWFASQQELEDRVRQLAVQPKPRVVPQDVADNTIYFLCADRENRKQAASLLDYLYEHKIKFLLPDWNCPADQAMAKHVQMLEQLDGCLVYLGDTEREWVDNTILRLRKHIRERNLNTAFYLGPPPEDFKADLKFLGFKLFDQPEPAARFFTGAPA